MRAAIVVYAARLLGAASWGAFSYALGVATFLTVFSDIGINALITKETARNPELKDKYLSTAFFVKIGLMAILLAGTLIAFPFLTNIEEAAMIMPILIFVFAFDTLRDLGSALSRALEKMQIESLVGVFTNLAIVVLGFILLTIYKTSLSLAYAYAIGSGVGLIAIFFTLRKHFKNLFKNFNKALIKPILTLAWPFGLMSLMGVIMLNTDIIMLGWLRSAEDVGYYSAAQKLIHLLYVLPSLLATSMFPVISRLVKISPNMVRAMLEKVVSWVLAGAIFIAISGIILAPLIIKVLFGAEYIPAILTFQILMATIVIVYPSMLLSNAIFAYDQQKSFVLFVSVAAIGNVIFNFLFIPIYGIEGAAISTIFTQLITNSLIWLKMKKISGFKLFRLSDL